MLKRLLALVLVLALTLSNLPAAALAAEFTEPADQETIIEEMEKEEIPEEIPEESEEIPEETENAAEEADGDVMPMSDDGLYSPAFTFHSDYPVSYFNKITEFEADPDEENVFYLRYYPDPYMDGTAWAETAPGTFVVNDSDKCFAELVSQDQYESVYKITLNELGNEWVDGQGIGDTWPFIVWHDGIVHWEQDGTWMQGQFNGAGILYITNEDATETIVTPPVYPPEGEDPDDSQNPSYLTMSWLQNDGQGFYERPQEQYGAFRVMPGQEIFVIFYLNYWNGQEYVCTPTFVEAEGDLNLEHCDDAAPDQENSAFFYRVTTGTWDQEVQITAAEDSNVGGVVGFTDRNELCIYNSPVMSNDTCVAGPFVYDLNLGNDNEIYVGFDNDYWTVTGFYNEYNWCLIDDTDNPNVKRLYFSGDTERLLAQGYDDYFAIKVTAIGENGEDGEFVVNFSLTPDHSTIPHDPYLTYGWINWWEDGLRLSEEPSNDYNGNFMPGMEVSYCFVLNTWDEASMSWVRTPVIPENDYGLIIEPVPARDIAPDQEFGAGFAYMINPGVWDMNVPLYVTLEDGTRVGGITVDTFRSDIAIYNSPELSNDTYIYEFVADYNSDDNHFYLGMDSDWVSPNGEPYIRLDEYKPFFKFEKVTDTVYKVTLTRAYLERILEQGGEDCYGGFSWPVRNGFGESWENGVPCGLWIRLDPKTVPHDPYLTFGWLHNWDDDWFDPGEWHGEEGTNMCPGDWYSVIFFLHLWDEEQGCFVEHPVPVSELKSNGVDFEVIVDSNPEENSDCYVAMMPRDSAFQQDVEVYVEHEGQKVSLPYFTVDLHQLAFYTSEDIGFESLLRGPLEIDPFGENVVYLGFYDPNGKAEVYNVGLTEMEDAEEPLATIEQVKDNVWKVTATDYAIDWTANNYMRYVNVWAEYGVAEEGWTQTNSAGFDLSRMALPVQATIEFDGDWYEVIDGGYVRNYRTGEVDPEWDGEYVTELPEGAAYDVETNTLTLDNYHGESFCVNYYNQNWETGEIWYNLPTDTLTIELIGENSLISDEDVAMFFSGGLNVVFTGDGSLHVKSTNSPEHKRFDDTPMNYPAMWVDGGSVTFEENVNVTVEIAGTALEGCWEYDEFIGVRPAHLTALDSNRSSIRIRDNAVLTTVVPQGAKSNGSTLPENDPSIFYDDRNPGGYSGIHGFSQLVITGGTLNTSDLHLNWGYFLEDDNYFEDGNFQNTSFYMSGGTVNIDALGEHCTMEEWRWNEQTQEDELRSYEGLRYVGLDAGMGAYIDISGGQLNIDVDPSEAYEEIPAFFNGMNLIGTDLLISGGEINFTPGYNGTMLQMETVDYSEEIYFVSYLNMTGGKLNFNGKDDCRVDAINLCPRSAAEFKGGTITADNADFRMGGNVVFDGTDLTGIHLDYYSDGQFRFNSGLLSLHEESSIMMGQGEMNGGTWDLSEAGVYVHGGFHFNDGEITIVNEGEEIFWPALIVETYFAMNNEAELNLVQNGIAPAMEVRGTFHQMDDSIVNIEHFSIYGEAAVFVPDGPENETHGTMLLNDGLFQVSALGDEPVAGLRTDSNSLLELGEGEMVLNNATVEMGGYMSVLGADFRMNANLENKNEDEWYIAFLGGVGSDLTVLGGTMTIDTKGYDCAFDLCGNYQQKNGKVYVNSDNMAMAIKGVAVIEDGELNLKGTTGYTQNYVPEITTDCKLFLFGGVMNIEAEVIGMELTGRTEIAGGQLNIKVSGTKIIEENTGAILMGRGILMYPYGMEASLVISGGEHSITVPTKANGYVDSGLQAILAADSKAEFLGGTLRTNSLHGIMSDSTIEGLQFVLGDGMAAYDLDTGRELIPMDHVFYADEDYQPTSPEDAVYIEYIRVFEKDNKPGDIFTEEGVQWAGNVEITARKPFFGTVTSDVEELLPGKKATLTAAEFASDAKLIWTLAEGDKDYVTLKVGKNNTATLTAKKNKELRQVTVTVFDGIGEASVAVTVLPVVSKVDILSAGGKVLTGQTVPLFMNVEKPEYNVAALSASCTPAESFQNVTWKSSNTKYATVDENGLVTVLVPGKTVTITATATDGSGKKATVTFKTAIPPTGIELTGSAACAVGKTITLNATVQPENATNKKVTWYIVDGEELVTKNAVASISGGKLKGLAPGKVTVRAAAADLQEVFAELTVTIMPAVKAVDILGEDGSSISKKTVDLLMSTTGDNTMQLDAVNAPEYSAQEVTWKSSNEKVAIVSQDGLVTALVPGKSVKITATAADGTGKSAYVTVKTVQPMENVTISGSTVAAAGKTITLTADIYPENTTNKKLVWSIVEDGELVTKNAFASISSGKLKIDKKAPEGETVTVRAQWAGDVEGGQIFADWNVTIYETAASKVIITDAWGHTLSGTVELGMSTFGENTLELSATVEKAEAAQEVIWTSSNVKYATVDEYGVVTVLVPGKTATITATAADGSGKKATVKIKGVQPVETLSLAENLVLDGNENLFVAAGKSLKLAPSVVIFPENASSKKLTWSVEKNDYGVKISSSGVLSTNAKKVTEMVTVTVTAQAASVIGDKPGIAFSFDVDVYPATKGVVICDENEATVTGKTITGYAGGTVALYADSTNAGTANVYTWKSSSEKYATVDADGTVTLSDTVGKTVTITATAADGSGKKATVKIKIEERQEPQLVTPGKLTVAVSPDFYPMAFVDPYGIGRTKFVGFDLVLAQEIAWAMDLELVVKPMSFGGCQNAVYNGEADIAVSAFTWTQNRAENYALSDFYYPNGAEEGNVVLIRKGNDAMTEAVNAVLAYTESQWEGWYEEVTSIPGIEQSYDDEGNIIG